MSYSRVQLNSFKTLVYKREKVTEEIQYCNFGNFVVKEFSDLPKSINNKNTKYRQSEILCWPSVLFVKVSSIQQKVENEKKK